MKQAEKDNLIKTKQLEILKLQSELQGFKEITVELDTYHLPHGPWLITGNGTVTFHPTTQSVSAYVINGVSRESKTLAEDASRNIRAYQRILAWRDAKYGPYVFKKYSSNCYITYDMDAKEYFVAISSTQQILNVVYMDKDAALELKEQLNKGIFDIHYKGITK
jgi:hypothetical protein